MGPLRAAAQAPGRGRFYASLLRSLSSVHGITPATAGKELLTGSGLSLSSSEDAKSLVLFARMFQTVLCAKDIVLFKHFFAEGVAPELLFLYWMQDLCYTWGRRFGLVLGEDQAKEKGFAYDAKTRPFDLVKRMWTVCIFEGSFKMLFRVFVGFFELMSTTLRKSNVGTAERILELLYQKGQAPNKDVNAQTVWNRGLNVKITRKMLGAVE